MMKLTCKLIDDDGCLVISTISSMKRFRDEPFDYGFPDEVIQLMRDHRIVAWESGGEYDHRLEIDFPESYTPDPSAIGPFHLVCGDEDDEFIFMPYSQFTYASACSDGLVKDTKGLSFFVPKSPGHYHVYIAPRGEAQWRISIISADDSKLYELGEELPEPWVSS